MGKLSGVVCALALAVMPALVGAGPLLDALRQARQNSLEDGTGQGRDAVAMPAGSRKLENLAYGHTAGERLDVYVPAEAHQAPVLLMVHGGAWRFGDKQSAGVVAGKWQRWGGQGWVVVSMDYGLLPDVAVDEQARQVARALAWVQRHAGEWGGDGRQVVLMGHSAGAHLVSLLTASATLARDNGVRDWPGTVVLDSAAVDVAALMRARHLPLYDHAFGTDPAYWDALSPLRQLGPGRPPMLLVCSSRRQESCPNAQRLQERAQALGDRATVLAEDLSHMQINRELGLPGPYTTAVERFMSALSPELARHLAQ